MTKGAARSESMHGKLNTSEKLAFIQREYETVDELIETAGRAAVELGYAEEGFVEDVIAREKEYPTGLNAVMPIAIPHVGTHCLKSFLSVTTLKKPIGFEPMDGRGDQLDVQIVFMFGLVDHRDQVTVLKKLAQMFKDKEALTRLVSAETAAAGCGIIADYLGDLVEIG